jgi:hypothetical protein
MEGSLNIQRGLREKGEVLDRIERKTRRKGARWLFYQEVKSLSI